MPGHTLVSVPVIYLSYPEFPGCFLHSQREALMVCNEACGGVVGGLWRGDPINPRNQAVYLEEVPLQTTGYGLIFSLMKNVT